MPRLALPLICSVALGFTQPATVVSADTRDIADVHGGQQVADNAAAQSPPTAQPPLRRVGFSITSIFAQFEIYDTDSDRAQLSYNYRSYGFKTGFTFRWNEDWYGLFYVGYGRDTDNVVLPRPIRNNFDVARFGGNLRYRLARGLFVGGNLAVQPFWSRFRTPTVSGRRNGYSVSGGPFLSYTAWFDNWFASAAPSLGFGYTSTGSTGFRGNQGSQVSLSLGLSGGRRIGNWAVIGVNVTPNWILYERSAVKERANGPFNLGVGGFGKLRLSGPLWLYGSYGYGFHRGARSAQSGIVGLSWQFGR